MTNYVTIIKDLIPFISRFKEMQVVQEGKDNSTKFGNLFLSLVLNSFLAIKSSIISCNMYKVSSIQKALVSILDFYIRRIKNDYSNPHVSVFASLK